MKTKSEEKFSEYYEKWVYHLQAVFLPQLIGAARSHGGGEEVQELVSKLTAHHKEYYTEKWAAAHVDVLPFYSPCWCTPLEKAYSWFTGWKPSTVFRLVASVDGLSEEQVKKIEQLRVKIKYEEARIEREMERQQVGLADRKLVDLARFSARTMLHHHAAAGLPPPTTTVEEMGGTSKSRGMMEAAVRSIAGGLEKLMKAADCVRLKTLKGLLDVMTPLQCVDFLAAVSILHIQLRQFGLLRRHQLRLHSNHQFHLLNNTTPDHLLLGL